MLLMLWHNLVFCKTGIFGYFGVGVVLVHRHASDNFVHFFLNAMDTWFSLELYEAVFDQIS